jgi:hypothetical protein
MNFKIIFNSCHGSKIVHTPDQNETDFTKSIRLVNEEVCARDIKVYIFSFNPTFYSMHVILN